MTRNLSRNIDLPKKNISMSNSISFILFFCTVSYTTLLALLGYSEFNSLQASTSFTINCINEFLEIATCLVVALLIPKRLYSKRWTILIIGSICTLAAIARWTSVTATTYDLWAIYYSAGIIGDIAAVILWLTWYELYARMDMKHVLTYYLIAHICSALFSMIIISAPFTLYCLITAILPIASIIAICHCANIIDDFSFTQGEAITKDWTFPWRPLLLMSVITLTNTFIRNKTSYIDTSFSAIGATVACAVALIYFLISGANKFNIWTLFRFVFPFAFVGLICVLPDNSSLNYIGSLFSTAASALFTVFLTATLCNLSYRYGANALFLFGLLWIGIDIGDLAGMILSEVTLSTSADITYAIVSIIALLVVMCSSFLIGNYDSEITWNIRPKHSNKLISSTNMFDELGTVCAITAREFGLTRREEEILILLAQNKTAADIEQALSITNATVKSHTRLIYQKLGVHSRRELIDLVHKQIADYSLHHGY